MSIIIRLQNLPINAKSADVRHFFGGLRIPSGGVHILGGDKGDAFIAFNSDEDARLAMRKDGGKIKDSRVKLYLSSYMEMKYEVDKITKIDNFSLSRSRSPERRFRRSKSPINYDRRKERLLLNRPPSRSPFRFRSRSPSPKRSRKSVSPFLQRARSRSPGSSNYRRGHEMSVSSNSNFEFNDNNLGPSTSELEARLERRITEALENNSAFAVSEPEQPPPFIPGLDIYNNEFQAQQPAPSFPFAVQNIPSGPVQNMQFPPAPPFWDNNALQFPHPGFPPPGIPPPFSFNSMGFPNAEAGIPPPNQKGFYATVSGLELFWSYKEIQSMFIGVFIPERNIQWEMDNMNLRTGTVFIKLLNREDFEKVLSKATFFFNNRRITVSECPEFISRNYFQDMPDREESYMTQKKDLCYTLKGLPFACTIEDVMHFFQGLEVSDVVIFYNRDAKATGIGYVGFSNARDFEAAYMRNGQKMGHRFIQLFPTTDRDMTDAKYNHPSAQSFTTYRKLLEERNMPPNRRPLCILMTGLPFHTSIKKLQTFFEESGIKPDAIHVTLNKKKQSDGRAFVEFINFRDFDEALKFHGTNVLDNMICIKQILYDEMIKILDSQKSKHYFETPVNIGIQANVPEKLPYVWEPPDTSEDQRMNLNIVEERILHSPKQHHRPNINRPNLKQITMQGETNKPKFVDHSSPQKVSSLKPVIKEKFMKPKQNNPFKKQNYSSNKQIKKSDSGEDNRQPIKFNVNKQLPVTKVNDTFDASKNEEKFKLSKLSPEKEIFKETEVKKIQKTATIKNFNVNKQSTHTSPKAIKGQEIKVLPSRSKKPIKKEHNFRKDSYSRFNLKNKKFPRKRGYRERGPFVWKIDNIYEEQIRNPSPNYFESFPRPHSPSPMREYRNSPSLPHDMMFQRGSPLHVERFESPPIPPPVERFLALDSPPRGERFISSPIPPPEEIFLGSPSPPGVDRFISLSPPHKKRFQGKTRAPHFKKASKSTHGTRYPSPPRAPECTVQMSGVSSAVGTEDLLNFLNGFAFDKDSIIRRYDDNGIPTNDVRVTFLNRKEAELVIRTLNGRRLKDMRVNMFIP